MSTYKYISYKYTHQIHYYYYVIDRYIQIFILIVAYTYQYNIYLYTYIPPEYIHIQTDKYA